MPCTKRILIELDEDEEDVDDDELLGHVENKLKVEGYMIVSSSIID